MKTAEISVIMITDGDYEVCRRTISYLKAQTIADQIEFLLVGESRDVMQVDEPDLAPFHSYKIIEIGKVFSTGHGLAAGTLEATSPLVCYAEEHGYPEPRLMEVLVQTARDKPEYRCFGWSMVPSNPGTVAWAHIYGQFEQAVAPLESGEVDRTGGHHALYRRDLLMEYKDQLVDVFGCEAVLQEDLQRRGLKIWMIGEVSSGHTQISSFWSYLYLEFVAMRWYAAARANNLNWGWGKRLMYVAGSPAIPFVRLRRKLPYIRKTGRWKDLMPQIGFIIFAANCAGTVGEVMGYLFGYSNKAMHERMRIELDRYSHVRAADVDQKHQMSPGA